MKNLIILLLKRIFALLTGKVTFLQGLNFILFNLAKEKVVVNYHPLRLGIFVTGKCNLACSMCLTHSPLIPNNPFKYQGSKDMDLATFQDILKKFPAALHVSIIGNGEPLLNKDIFKIIHYAKKKKKNVTIFSNGLILDQYIDQLLEHKVDSINVSINAINSDEYQRFTGHNPSVFLKCLENLKKLCQEKIKQKSPLKIFCSIIVDKQNYETMPEMIKFAESIGVDHVHLSHFMPSPTDINQAKERCLYISDTEALYLIEELALDRYQVEVTFPRILDGNTNNRLCRDSLISMSIDGAGNIGVCERQLLNTKDQGTYLDKNVFNNQHFQKLRKKFLMGTDDLDTPCKTCYNNTTCLEKTIPAKKND